MTTIGIDVGAKSLVVALRHKTRMQKVKTYGNTTNGHKQIKKLAEKYLKYGEVLIAMEATGAYYLDLAIALSANEVLKIVVANPRATKAFSQASMGRSKTDKLDAEMLALFAEKMDYPLWERPSKPAIQLRYTARMLNTFTINKASAHNHLHALESCNESPKELIECVCQEITFFEKMIDRIKQEAISIIKQNKYLEESFNLIQTIKGFGETSAIQLLAEIMLIPKDLTHRQWVAFAGLDPRHVQSGTSVHKKPRISKAGNRHLRKALFMPALSASRNDPYVKGFFIHLVEDQKLAKLQAIVAIMRKLLHAIHGMMLHRKSFDNTRFFERPAIG